MDNLDEKIIAAKQSTLQKERTLETTNLKESSSPFKEVEILDGKLLITLPSNFSDMPQEYAEQKYPSGQRPEHIKSNPDTSVSIGFTLLDLPIPEDALEQEMNYMRTVLKKTNPAMQFYTSNIETLEQFKISWFDFKSYGIDEELYNIMFVGSIPPSKQQGTKESKALHGVFNCRYADYNEWSKIAVQILKSLKLKETEVSEND